MKKQYLLSLIIFLCTIFVVASSSIVSHSDDDKLIVKACSDTPKPELCFNYIKSDPSSKNAKNVSDVGIIMARVLKRKAKVARDKIHRIASARDNKPDLKVQLKACLQSYNNILHIDVKVAIDSFKDGNPRLAEIGADTAADGVSDCEESFNGKSPITIYNNRIHDIALLLAAIAKELQVEN
ncbi:hypothetical protein PIB30_026010 [Stylosanthes scabra]|uniref:Pectinesterase inhibitor domain-containing protein n=1 Tax=Stylosanthes scabra TaxID=79078 RepID=A0ABU6VBR3_9FABA|nr:hypothetical protein [Stylosanthes scabra]